MKARQVFFVVAAALMSCLLSACESAPAQSAQGRMVRIAELEIDPTQLENYKALLKEEIEASIRLEPGVLTLYAVSLKDSPQQIRILETYADADAYNAHIKSPHFEKYKKGTEQMVKSLSLVEMDPILLGIKK
jgi:quinol monooxygenase YgiN